MWVVVVVVGLWEELGLTPESQLGGSRQAGPQTTEHLLYDEVLLGVWVRQLLFSSKYRC